MASKTLPVKKTSTTSKESTSTKSTATKPVSTKTASNKPTDPEVTILKKATCPTLSGAGAIGYEISITDNGTVLFGLISNSGSGHFNSIRVGLNDLLSALQEFGKKHPIKSLALKSVFPPNSSSNNTSFMMSVLLAEGLVESAPDGKRHYRLVDPAKFLASVEEWKSQHSSTNKTVGKVTGKAQGSMQKGKAKPATGK